jgi:hypothetical protein
LLASLPCQNFIRALHRTQHTGVKFGRGCCSEASAREVSASGCPTLIRDWPALDLARRLLPAAGTAGRFVLCLNFPKNECPSSRAAPSSMETRQSPRHRRQAEKHCQPRGFTRHRRSRTRASSICPQSTTYGAKSGRFKLE